MLQTEIILVPGWGKKLALVLVILVSAAVLLNAHATSIPKQNLVDLIAQSERILLGTVATVSDGYTKQAVPFTEIKLQVTESLKGGKIREHTFRQFGLIDSDEGQHGSDYPGISPVSFLHWESGESVLVFLHQPAHLTGLQTTVGLSQGKLSYVRGRFESSNGITYLFENLVVEAGDLTPDQIDMLSSTEQEVDADSLLDLLRRAVNENWVEKGVMHHGN
jgi:hypothetical protein